MNLISQMGRLIAMVILNFCRVCPSCINLIHENITFIFFGCDLDCRVICRVNLLSIISS